MPTPLATARQCLTPAAARALDDAAAVARRRSHPQTTSLHAVSALLSPTSSVLRDACVSSRGSSSAAAYATTRTQLKALELCLSVSLDRQPSTHRAGGPGSDGEPDPPVSNSLMAAIKRSQANQRRQPENFHLYHQMSLSGQSSAAGSSSSSMACVKVELQHLILSILDDPVVSRVFSEAGFRSPEIKLAIVRPLPPHLFPFYTRTPLFLRNQTDKDLDPNNNNPGRRPFSFPFPGIRELSGGDPDSRRVGEALGAGRNPLLVGASACGALRSFYEAVQGRIKTGGCGPLPMEMSDLSIVCVESEIQKFVSGPGSCDDQRLLSSRFEEVHRMARHCLGPGLVINYGDLKDFVRGGETVGSVVGELTRFLKVYDGKVRLLGAAENYETYLKFFNLFPSIERDWDLQLLHIASLRASMPPQPCSRPSLMESFVPFGGFFSSPSNMNGPLSSSYRCLSRCQLCNEKCEKELTALSSGVLAGSVSDQCQYSLPPWLQLVDKGLDMVLAKDDGMVLSEKVAGLQKKWDSICQHFHHTQPFPGADIDEVGSQGPVFVDFQFLAGMKENADVLNSNDISVSPNEGRCRRLFSCSSMDSQEMSITNPSVSFPVIRHAKNDDLLLNRSETENTSKTDNSEPGGLGSPCSLSNSSIRHCQTSHSSTASVATDLGLGISSLSNEESLKPTRPTSFELMHDSSRCSSVSADLFKNVSHHPSAPSSRSGLNKRCLSDPTDPRDFKTLSRTLAERIGWQAKAITVISRAVANHWASNGKCHGTASLRGDIWFTFLGPDRFSKKKIAIALAEILFGSRENCICVDFGPPGGMMCTSPTFHLQDTCNYDPKSRGITIVDYISGELRKKPLSIVFLENVDKADVLTQNRLSHAIRTSKFSDSHGREVGGNNAIFITTSRFNKNKKFPSPSEEAPTSYSEEKILGVKSCSIQIVIGPSIGNCISNPMLLNKRKLIGKNVTLGQHTLEVTKRAYNPSSNVLLDLNLPAEANDVHNANERSCCSSTVSDIPMSWLEEFFELVDETVIFEPFDFDAVARKLMDHARECFCSIVGLDCSLEIDSETMEQMVAAACLSDKDGVVENWMDQTLSRGFAEAREMYNLTGDTVVKLVTCVGTPVDRQSPGVHLPAKIILNRSPQDA